MCTEQYLTIVRIMHVSQLSSEINLVCSFPVCSNLQMRVRKCVFAFPAGCLLSVILAIGDICVCFIKLKKFPYYFCVEEILF